MRYSVMLVLSFLMFSIYLSCDSQEEVREEPAVVKNEPAPPIPITIPENIITTKSGLKYIDITEGDGDNPKAGQNVSAHYTGLLMSGKKFDSSYDRNAPLEFTAGVGDMIKGFDEGILSMKKGGKRTLFIPSELAYGSNGIPGVIPPDAMIVFEVELVDIK